MSHLPRYFLLSRLLMRFQKKQAERRLNLSSATFTPEGHLWVASDEGTSLERLKPLGGNVYGEHQSFALGDFISLPDPDGEMDIEGLDYSDGYLWLTGSHSTKRSNAKGKNPQRDMERITQVKTEVNRYTLARIPVVEGELFRAADRADSPERKQSAGCLERIGEQNALIEALREDLHLGPYLTFPIPSKENGFDIEGMAVHKNRVFLGFRGPVLRGWAMVLEIEVEEKSDGVLALKPFGKGGAPYKKHFVDLDGLGVRELLLVKDDLIILAGPTMELEGSLRVYALQNVRDLGEDSLHERDGKDLKVLFDLPFNLGYDHAEGMALCPCLEEPNSLLVVYDAPDPDRFVGNDAVYADVFQLHKF